MTNRTLAAILALALPTAALAHPRAGHNLRGAPARSAKNAATQLLYYGGPVIANPKVYAIWWGSEASIAASVTATSGGIGSFFAGVLDSLFIDAWAQYRTDLTTQAGTNQGKPGTGQLIGRGNFAGSFTLSGVPPGDVTDAQVQTALEAGIQNHSLPAMDANTIYSIFFPATVTVSLPDPDGGPSCMAFGAYHDQTVALGAAYLVIPDCNYGFLDFTSVTSHELAEATTDLKPTPGASPDFPQAWNDNMGNEAADLCEATGGNLSTGSGTFAVQGIWDQRSVSCQIAAHAAQDFSVAISPHAFSLSTGGSATLNIQTALVAGTAQTLALSVKAPAGVTATLGASSVTAGGSTTLAISAANAITDGQIVVTALFTSGAIVWSHSAALLINASAVADTFTLDVGSAAAINPGQSATFAVTLAAGTGTSPAVALSTSGLPTAVTASFSPASSAVPGTSTLTLKTTRALAAGTYTFEVAGTGDVTATSMATLEVVAPVVVDAGTDAGTGSDAGTDGGQPLADGGTGTTTVSSGCAQTPVEALGIPLFAMLALAVRSRRRKA